MQMNKLFAIIILIMLFGAPMAVKATDDVNLSVSVLARKSTDTINDFDFCVLQSSGDSITGSVVANDPGGQVKGVSIQGSQITLLSRTDSFFRDLLLNKLPRINFKNLIGSLN